MTTVTTIDPIKRNEGKKLKVAAYCRVSTASDEQEESLTAQREHYENYIKSNPEWEFAGLYFDEGISGTKIEKREGLKKMLADAQNGKIDFILTKSISRFSRNNVDCLNMTRDLLSVGVGIYFEKENINTRTMGSEFLLAVMSSLAESESRNASTNLKWGFHERMKNGSYIQATPPYGYEKKDGKLVINHEKAEVVRMIYRLTLEGLGTEKIAQKLDEMGIPSPRNGKQWYATTVRQIVQNERYIGDSLYEKTYSDEEFYRHRNHGERTQYYLKHTHEPIITRDAFEKANAIINQRGMDRGIRKEDEKYQNRYLFSGKLVCAKCGAHLKHCIIRVRVSGPYSAWKCPTHIRAKEKCSMPMIEESKLRTAFTTLINKLIFSRKQLAEPYLKDLKNLDPAALTASITEIKETYSSVMEQQDTIAQLAADGVLDSATYQDVFSKLNKEMIDLNTRKDLLTKSLNNNNKFIAEAIKLVRYLKSTNISRNMDEVAFQEFVDEVIIYSGTQVGFKLKCGLLLKEELK